MPKSAWLEVKHLKTEARMTPILPAYFAECFLKACLISLLRSLEKELLIDLFGILITT